MTPARSLAASVVALGVASSLTTALPASAAPAACQRAENYAAQSGAEILRIDRLELRSAEADRPRSGDTSHRVRPHAAVDGAADRVPPGTSSDERDGTGHGFDPAGGSAPGG